MTSAVSVVIPAYNCAAYLDAALGSVLGQRQSVTEVLVVDDGSTDATADVMAAYGPPVRYIRQRNQGVSVARNRGVAESRGDLIAFLDADDTWLPGKLERQLAAMRDRPTFGMCYSAFLVVDEHFNVLEVRRSNRSGSALEDLLTRGNVVGSICTVLCERPLLSSLGGFDPSFSQCADWEMWTRLSTKTDFLYVDEPLVTYRQHDSNMSRDPRLLEEDSIRVLERAFALPSLPRRLRARRRRALARNDIVLAGTYFGADQPREALRCALRGVARDPRQASHLGAFPLRWLRRWIARPRQPQ